MNNYITITPDNINEIKYEDICCLTLAENGAMGIPGSIFILLKNKKLYFLHYAFSEYSIKILFPIFPPLKSLSCAIGNVYNLDDNWIWFDMGVGNYLFVRKNNADQFKKEIKRTTPTSHKFPKAFLYKNWLKIAHKLLDDKVIQ